MLVTRLSNHWYELPSGRLGKDEVGGSNPPSSPKKHRKLRFSVLFCCKNALLGAGQNVGQPPDPHPDPHAEMGGKGERVPERRRFPSLRYFCFFCSHHLRHEAAHGLCCLVLLLAGGMGVGAERESGVVVSQHTADRFHVHSILQRQRCEGVPLRYNYDKPEKPRRIKGFEVFSLVFSSFSKPKNHTEISRIIGGVSLTTNE